MQNCELVEPLFNQILIETKRIVIIFHVLSHKIFVKWGLGANYDIQHVEDRITDIIRYVLAFLTVSSEQRGVIWNHL